MVTEETKITKKCCLYASDYHLEMILLPYIKERMDRVNFVIITQNDLEETVNKVLDRTNLKEKDKREILNLNWKQGNKEKIKYIENIDKSEKIEVIVKGGYSFIKKINEELDLLQNKKIMIINCFCICDDDGRIESIKREYDNFMITKKV